jgi:hypothetical protein
MGLKMNGSLRNDNLVAETQLRENLVEKYRDITARMGDILTTAGT